MEAANLHTSETSDRTKTGSFNEELSSRKAQAPHSESGAHGPRPDRLEARPSPCPNFLPFPCRLQEPGIQGSAPGSPALPNRERRSRGIRAAPEALKQTGQKPAPSPQDFQSRSGHAPKRESRHKNFWWFSNRPERRRERPKREEGAPIRELKFAPEPNVPAQKAAAP